MRNILITGATGLLGPYLAEEARNYGWITTTSRHSGDIRTDLAVTARAVDLIEQSKPDWIVHAAGMTNVDACERNPGDAYRANETVVHNLVEALPAQTHVLLISSDQVYPDTHGPHKEETTNPVNVYGNSKLAGERAALCHAKVTVVRVNFFGRSFTSGRFSLDDFIIQSLKRKENVTLFSDVLFSPLHMKTLSKLSFRLLDRGIMGVFNMGSRSGMSKASFGIAVAERCSLQTKTVTFGMSTSVLGRASRTKDLRMDVTKLEKALGIKMPSLSDEISKLP